MMKKKILVTTCIAFLGMSMFMGIELNKKKLGKAFLMSYTQECVLADSVSGDTLAIKFEDVVSDSRCPQGVMCVWEGQVELKMLIANKDTLLIHPIEIQYGEMDSITEKRSIDTTGFVNYKNYRFALLKVDPTIELGREYSKGAYMAQLQIDRLKK